MHIGRIDLNLLVVLDAIWNEGSITRAAAGLHLTQPAVSHALGRLRETFGDPLFVREGRAMVPTARARQLIEPVRSALRGLQLGLNGLESFDPACAERRFVIGIRDVLEATLLPPLLHTLATQAPGIDLAAVRADRRELEAELAAGTLDLALDVLLPLSPRVQRLRISHDRLVVVMRAGHPLALASKALDLDTYLASQHVMVSSRRNGPGLEDHELGRLGLKRRIRLRCQHYYSAVRVVSQTDLLLTMPAGHALVAGKEFGTVSVDFPMALPEMDAYLYWHTSADGDPANRWLRERVLLADPPRFRSDGQ